MSGPYVIYDMQNGKIAKVVQCPMTVLPLQIEDHQTYIEGNVVSADQYVHPVNKVIQTRPTLKAKLTDMVLHGVPETAQVIIDGVTYEADGQAIELEFDMPGSYLITVVCWPFLDWSTTLEVKS